MESQLATLKAYIGGQRINGVSDEQIYQSLVTAGWQVEVVSQAFAMLSVHNTPQPVASGINEVSADTYSDDASSKFKLSTGRLNRLGFLMAHIYILVYFAAALILAVAARGVALVNAIVFLLGGIGVLVVMILPFFFYARRWHDINQSGWLSLLLLIPGAALPLAIILLIIPGTRGQNQFGATHQKTVSPLDVYGLRS